MDLAPVCVGHWKMNDNADNTDVLDSSGNDHNGTFNDPTNPNTSAHHVVGKINGALIFDGTNDYVAVPDDASLDITGPLTLASWTKYTSTSAGYIINKGKTGTAYGYWAGNNAGKIRFGNNAGFKTTTSTFNDGNWHFVVCVYEGGGAFGALKIYVDNVEQATTTTGTFNGFAATNESLILGARMNDSVVSGFFNGSIDNAIVFNKALSPDEMSYLYNNGDGTENISPNGLAGVTMLGLPSSPVTDANGFYTDTVNDGFSGTVTPSKAAYTFTPTERVYSDVAEDHIGDNYTAAPSTYTISGTVTVDGNGLADVQMSGLPGDPCTNASGFYTATVDYGFSGTVTPSKTGYTFSPTERVYSNVAEDHIGDNYTAIPNTYTISGTVTVGGDGLVDVRIEGPARRPMHKCKWLLYSYSGLRLQRHGNADKDRLHLQSAYEELQ